MQRIQLSGFTDVRHMHPRIFDRQSNLCLATGAALGPFLSAVDEYRPPYLINDIARCICPRSGCHPPMAREHAGYYLSYPEPFIAS
jgi:hypothetical protein